MAVVETKEYAAKSWVQRLGDSFKGIITGLALFIAGFPLLFWNEGRAVARAKSLDAGQKAVVSVVVDAVDPANEGKLVHVSGLATTKDVLSDAVFGVTSTAIRLERKVQIFQWVENEETKREKRGDKVIETTRYTYEKKWCDEPVSSEGFKEHGHENPPLSAFQNLEQLAGNVTLGAFHLGPDYIERIGGETKFPLAQDHVLPPELVGATVREGGVYISYKAVIAATAGANTAVAGALSGVSNTVAGVVSGVSNAVATAASVVVGAPEVGDQRIAFKRILPHDISIVARQTGEKFAPWTAPNGEMVSLQCDGLRDAAAMFANAKRANSMITWIFRLIGFFLMYFGLKAVFGPITTLVDAIPILNTIVDAGVSFAALVVSAACSFVTIGIAWIVYRPVVGILLIVMAVAILVLALMKKKAKAPAASAA